MLDIVCKAVWKVCGNALTHEGLNLHRSYTKALRGESEYIKAIRLWYLLYVCDYHFSITYGCSPVIHEDQVSDCFSL
jgi:hypothetical protein